MWAVWGQIWVWDTFSLTSLRNLNVVTIHSASLCTRVYFETRQQKKKEASPAAFLTEETGIIILKVLAEAGKAQHDPVPGDALDDS